MPRQAQSGEADRCRVCRGRLSRAPRGRRRRYCSDACRQRAYRRRHDGPPRRGLVKLYEADAREFLTNLPDGSVDLIVTDPPYKFDRGDSRFREWFDETIPDAEWPAIFREFHRVLDADSHAYVLGDYRVHLVFAEAARNAGFRVHTPLVWDKCSPGLGGLWRAQYELIGVFEKGRRRGNFKGRSTVLSVPRVVRRYPTEKPVALLRQLISQSSDRGELVLDPFCGSGSTGRAARELGRRALLCDLDAVCAARKLRNDRVAPMDKRA